MILSREEICNISGEDYKIRQGISLLQVGIKNREPWAPVLPLFALRGGLVVVDTALLYKGIMVVPASGRSATLANLHPANQGQTKMLARAQESVWWLG